MQDFTEVPLCKAVKLLTAVYPLIGGVSSRISKKSLRLALKDKKGLILLNSLWQEVPEASSLTPNDLRK